MFKGGLSEKRGAYLINQKMISILAQVLTVVLNGVRAISLRQPKIPCSIKCLSVSYCSPIHFIPGGWKYNVLILEVIIKTNTFNYWRLSCTKGLGWFSFFCRIKLILADWLVLTGKTLFCNSFCWFAFRFQEIMYAKTQFSKQHLLEMKSFLHETLLFTEDITKSI